jgi:tubby and related proteins
MDDVLVVKVMAKPPNGAKNLGHGNDPGGWSGPTDAMSMMIFSYCVKLKIPRELLGKSEYFVKQLEGPWKGQSKVEIPLKNTRGVDAFALACSRGLASKPDYSDLINSFNQFNIYSAAGMLKLPGLQTFCEDFIFSTMTVERFLAAMKHGTRYNRVQMLKHCYRWFKLNGALDEKAAKEVEEENLPTDRALAKAAGIKESASLTFNKANMEVYTSLRRADISVFNDLAEEEHREKSHVFVPPPLVEVKEEGNGDNSSEGGKAGGGSVIDKVKRAKGYPGLRRAYLARKRLQGENQDETHYLVHDEVTGDLLLAACCSDGRTFVLSSDPETFEKTAPSYMGIVRPNFTGTTHKCLDYGINPKKCPEGVPVLCCAVEHAAIVYETNVLGRVPNAMTVVIPKIDSNSKDAPDGQDYVPPHHRCELKKGLAKYYAKKSETRVIRMKTRQPIWSDEVDAWTMDFHGRVKLASKKNFQLIDVNKPDETLMLFGKVTKNHFSLDYKMPLTVVQALAVALSSFADKMMVT